MSLIAITGGATGTGTFTVLAPSTSVDRVLTLPDATATVLASTAVSASTTATVTNKIAVVLGGVTYYLLASTSGA